MTVVLIFSLGCLDTCNINISGYVRSMSDSSAIPGALVIVDPPGAVNTYTDSNGYYESKSHSTRQGDLFELHMIVTDVDGVNNGVFVSKDTLIYEEDTANNLNLVYEIDFYVEIVGDSTNSYRNQPDVTCDTYNYNNAIRK